MRASHRTKWLNSAGRALRVLSVFPLCVFLLSGCESVKSKRDDASGKSTGIVYWLPKRDILIKAVEPADDNTAASVVVSPGPAYPGYAHRFVLDLGVNPIGTQSATIRTSESGLLQTADASTTITLSEALQSLAKMNVAGIPQRAQPPTKRKKYCEPGEYEHLIDASRAQKSAGDAWQDGPCGYQISVRRLFSADDSARSSELGKTSASESAPGIFYRRELAYRVTVARDNQRREFIVMSPSESPGYFLDLGKSLFSNNATKVALRDGVPTELTRTKHGELTALLKLPADIIGAYFGAIGSMFTFRKTVTDSEANYLKSVGALELAKQNQQLCSSLLANATVVTEQIKAVCAKPD